MDFRTVADHCGFSDMLCSFRMYYVGTEATAYEVYENNMHTKYSGFTVCKKRTSFLYFEV